MSPRQKGQGTKTGKVDSLGRAVYNWDSHEGSKAYDDGGTFASPVDDFHSDEATVQGFSSGISDWVKNLTQDSAVKRIDSDESGYNIHLAKKQMIRISHNPYTRAYEVHEYDGENYLGQKDFSQEDEMKKYVENAAYASASTSGRSRMRRRRGSSQNSSGEGGFFYRMVSRIPLLPRMRG